MTSHTPLPAAIKRLLRAAIVSVVLEAVSKVLGASWKSAEGPPVNSTPVLTGKGHPGDLSAVRWMFPADRCQLVVRSHPKLVQGETTWQHVATFHPRTDERPASDDETPSLDTSSGMSEMSLCTVHAEPDSGALDNVVELLLSADEVRAQVVSTLAQIVQKCVQKFQPGRFATGGTVRVLPDVRRAVEDALLPSEAPPGNKQTTGNSGKATGVVAVSRMAIESAWAQRVSYTGPPSIDVFDAILSATVLPFMLLGPAVSAVRPPP